jgi:transcriptional regulator with XRE-family HTH domain
MTSRVYFHDTYQKRLAADFREARGRIVNFSPYATPDGVQRWRQEFRLAVERGVHVCVFIQEPDGWEHRNDDSFPLPSYVRSRIKKTMDAIELLASTGVHVTLRKNMHEKLVLIDDCILWDGSLNFLSHYKTTERLNRWVSRITVAKALFRHDALCRRPTENGSIVDSRIAALGKHILEKRLLLGWTHAQLAVRARTHPRTISALESGNLVVAVELLYRVCDVLDLDVGITESYLWHAIELFTRVRRAKLTSPSKRSACPGNIRWASLGKYLGEKRVLFGWSQAQLAKLARTNQRVVSEVETGKRNIRIDLLYRIFDIAGLDLVITEGHLWQEVESLTQTRRTPLGR